MFWLGKLKTKCRGLCGKQAYRKGVDFSINIGTKDKFKRLIEPAFANVRFSNDETDRIIERTATIVLFDLTYKDMISIVGRKNARCSKSKNVQYRIFGAQWSFNKNTGNWLWKLNVGCHIKNSQGVWVLQDVNDN